MRMITDASDSLAGACGVTTETAQAEDRRRIRRIKAVARLYRGSRGMPNGEGRHHSSDCGSY